VLLIQTVVVMLATKVN